MCVLKKISVFMNHEIFGSGGVATLMKSSFRRKRWCFYIFSCDNRETSYYNETMNSSFFSKTKNSNVRQTQSWLKIWHEFKKEFQNSRKCVSVFKIFAPPLNSTKKAQVKSRALYVFFLYDLKKLMLNFSGFFQTSIK